MGRIDRHAFAAAFADWIRDGLPQLAGEQITIEGKTLRGSRDGESKTLHLVSAFATQARLVLAAEPVGHKGNEINAIPLLLRQLELAGAVVSVDAISCQKNIAA